jgi:hypothetical protein
MALIVCLCSCLTFLPLVKAPGGSSLLLLLLPPLASIPLALYALPPAREMMLAAAEDTCTAGLGTVAGAAAVVVLGLGDTGSGTLAGDLGVTRACLGTTGDCLVVGAGVLLVVLGAGVLGRTGSGTASFLALGLGTPEVREPLPLPLLLVLPFLAAGTEVRLAAAAASATALSSFWRSNCCSLRPVVLTHGAPS